MKFNLSDFLQLDTKGLLAVNGGYNCNGSTNTTVYSNTYYSGGNSSTPNGGGSSGDNLTYTTRDNKDGTITKTGWVNGKAVIIDNLDSKTGEKVCQTQYPYGYYPTNNKNNSSKNSNSSSGGGSCSTPSSSPDSSSGKSNNPDGQGPSTTSSNPGGKDNTPHTGGTCPGTGGGTHIPPSDDGSGTGEDDGTETPNGGGICSGTETSGEGETGGEITNPDDPIDKTSGSFGQITDGSYADKLTMQYYLNDFPWSDGEFIDGFMYGTYIDKNGVEQKCKFSTVGCKEIGSAMIGSEFLDEPVSMITIQHQCDLNKDGNLSAYEIATGLNALLDEKYGDIYDVLFEDNISNIDLTKLEEIASKDDTYVLGFAQNCHGGHWVVLEGYEQDSSGKVLFTYDETSSNDIANNRTFVLGLENEVINSEKYAITRIQTFSRIAK